MARYQVEVTDTFGGEANYSWVRRYVIEGSTGFGTKAERKLVRDAKKVAGWTGLRCDTQSHGDQITLRPRQACWIMFISYIDYEPAGMTYDNEESEG